MAGVAKSKAIRDLPSQFREALKRFDMVRVQLDIRSAAFLASGLVPRDDRPGPSAVLSASISTPGVLAVERMFFPLAAKPALISTCFGAELLRAERNHRLPTRLMERLSAVRTYLRALAAEPARAFLAHIGSGR